MEQRPLRLGDIVDDYCPRERRITNHAIVAIVERRRSDRPVVRRATPSMSTRTRKVPRRRKKTRTTLTRSTTKCASRRDAGGATRAEAADPRPSPLPLDANTCRASAAATTEHRDRRTNRRSADDGWPAHRHVDSRPAARSRGRASRLPGRFPSSRCTSVSGRGRSGLPVRRQQGWPSGNGARQRQRQRFPVGASPAGTARASGQGHPGGGGGRRRHRGGGKNRQPK